MLRPLLAAISITWLIGCSGGTRIYRQPSMPVSKLALLEAPTSDIEISMIDDKFNGTDGIIAMRLNPRIYVQSGSHRIEVHLLGTDGYYQLHCEFLEGGHYRVERVREDYEKKLDRNGFARQRGKWHAFIIDNASQEVTCFK